MTSSQPSAQPWSRRTWAALIGIGAVIALIAGVLGAVSVRELGDQPGRCDAERVATKVRPSLVTVADADGSAIGSGIIIRADGIILTNDHVISAAAGGSLQVVLADGAPLPATVLGADPLTDLAVLQVAGSKLPALPISWNEPTSVGQAVVALGAPLSLSGTVDSGIISAQNRNIPAPIAGGGTTVLMDSFQTDMAITPGDSGGALVTCKGRLIGVNTAVSSDPAAGTGIGFAIPATIVERVTSDILERGHISHPWLGLSVAEISADTAAKLSATPGLYVQAVARNSPAAQAGIQVGDVITGLNDQQASSAVLSHLLLTAAVGDAIPATLIRDGQQTDATMTVSEQPGE